MSLTDRRISHARHEGNGEVSPMPVPDEVMRAYIAMWNARDENDRRRFADQALTENAALIYPTIEAQGRENIVAAIGRFQEQMPGAYFEATSGIEQHHGWLR